MRKLLVFGVAVLLLTACATTFIASTQQGLTISLESVNAFLIIEKANAVEMDKLMPGCHAFAEQLRVKFPTVYKDALAAVDAYKAASVQTGTPQNNVVITAAVVTSLAQSAQAYLAKWGTK